MRSYIIHVYSVTNSGTELPNLSVLVATIELPTLVDFDRLIKAIEGVYSPLHHNITCQECDSKYKTLYSAGLSTL